MIKVLEQTFIDRLIKLYNFRFSWFDTIDTFVFYLAKFALLLVCTLRKSALLFFFLFSELPTNLIDCLLVSPQTYTHFTASAQREVVNDELHLRAICTLCVYFTVNTVSTHNDDDDDGDGEVDDMKHTSNADYIQPNIIFHLSFSILLLCVLS